MLRKQTGQILLPGLMAVYLLATLSISFLAWGVNQLRHMRLDMAADATALSVARAQAGMLNTLATTNMGVNLFIQKADFPLMRQALGVMRVSAVPPFQLWQKLLKTQVIGFKAFPAGVGQTVSRLNGARGEALYFPAPMESYLNPQGAHVGILLNHFPFVLYRHIAEAYYVRSWSPHETRAQPPHKTTWVVKRGKHTSMASARVWLDIPRRNRLHNGGFPRAQEKNLRGVGIQSFYPQFNARLLPTPVIALKKLERLYRRWRRS